MVNKPLIRPYFLGGVALGGAARIPLTVATPFFVPTFSAFRFDGLGVPNARRFAFSTWRKKAVRKNSGGLAGLRVPCVSLLYLEDHPLFTSH